MRSDRSRLCTTNNHYAKRLLALGVPPYGNANTCSARTALRRATKELLSEEIIRKARNKSTHVYPVPAHCPHLVCVETGAVVVTLPPVVLPPPFEVAPYVEPIGPHLMFE